MAKKCVHKGCGQTYDDDNESCTYHPGPPVFHEGQKGWKCCKPRVLTFDEFLEIPPCTTGTHSNVEEEAVPEPKEAPKPTKSEQALEEALKAPTPAPRIAVAPPRSGSATPQPPTAPPESEDDDPSLTIPQDATCRRKGCGAKFNGSSNRSDDEQCTHHPGFPIFHEGSKGYSCCKRRVLEFDQFLTLPGCKTKPKHLFIGSGKAKEQPQTEELQSVRHDFYQTGTTVIATLYLKKISKEESVVDMKESAIDVDLKTQEKKRYKTTIPLFGPIKPGESSFAIKTTKLEFNLAKADGAGWPVFRADDPHTGEIIQTGRAGRA